MSVKEQGGGKLIPERICNTGKVCTVSQTKSGMVGVYRLETQMMEGTCKFNQTGIGSDKSVKESITTAFNYLKANSRYISAGISNTSKDYFINYQNLQGLGMMSKLTLPTLIAMCSVALGKPTFSSLVVLKDVSISDTVFKVEKLANTLKVCFDSGAKKILLPITSATDLGSVPSKLMGAFSIIFYNTSEEAIFKALGVE